MSQSPPAHTVRQLRILLGIQQRLLLAAHIDEIKQDTSHPIMFDQDMRCDAIPYTVTACR